ncbi:prostasin [Rana temporaria]|uniref:prostasin n=1 Tax=Rana temporaria TaxID=8407 RepID=UPI001AAD7378|nr:prostasin [Rana temporaria]
MGTFLRQFLVLLAALNFASSQVQDRIVGGTDGNIANYNWQVNVRYMGAPACGGSIISAQWILTACHCFPTEHAISDYDVIAGTTNLDPTDADTQTLMIEAVYKNPLYNEDAYSGDIAVVKLKRPLSLTSRVGTISLLAAGVQVPAGLICYVTGWGNTQQGVSLPNPKTMQVGRVQVVSSRTCQCLHSIDLGPKEPVTTIQSDMLCAGYKEGTTDACQGDSGGPLACNIGSKWYQVGVVSWGDKCAAKNRPGVYIKPDAYIDWIKGYVSDCKVESISIDQAPIPDNENGCKSADGNVYPYPNKGSAVLITFITLPLYWLSAYLLTNL